MQFAGYIWPSDCNQLRKLGTDGIETGGKAVGMGLREYWRGGCGEQGERAGDSERPGLKRNAQPPKHSHANIIFRWMPGLIVSGRQGFDLL